MRTRLASGLAILALVLLGCGSERHAEVEAEGAASSQFEFYECVVDEQRAFVRTDVALRERAPDPTRPHSLRIRVPFLDPRENGFPTGEEAEQMWALEDALTNTLAPAPLAGVLTSAGRRSWYLYTDDPDRDGDRARAVTREVLPDHEVEVGSFEDPAWGVYLDFLYPNDLAWNYITDRRVLDALEKEGDDGSRPRPVMYWAHFPSAEARAGFCEAVEAQGFAIEETYEDPETDDPYWVRFAHGEPLAPAEIFPHSERLFLDAREWGGTYDGWEAQALAAPTGPASPAGR